MNEKVVFTLGAVEREITSNPDLPNNVIVDTTPIPTGDAVVLLPSMGDVAPVVLLAHFIETRDKLVSYATSIVVTDDDTERAATAALKELTAAPGLVEEAKLKATKRYRDTVDSVNEQAKALVAPLLVAKDYIKKQLAAHADRKRAIQDQQRRERDLALQEAAREAARLREQGRAEEASAAIEAAKQSAPLPEGPLIKGTATGRQPEFTIVNPLALDRSYCSPDPAKIKLAMREQWKAFKGDEARFMAWAAMQVGLEFTITTKIASR